MKNKTKFIAGMCASLIIAGIPAGFAIHYHNEYETLQNSDQVQNSAGLVDTIENLRNSITELSSVNEGLNAMVDNLKAENEANKSLVKDLQSQVENLTAYKGQLESQANIDAQTIANLESQIETKSSEIDSLSATITANEAKINTLTTERNNLSARVNELESQLNNLSDENEDYVLQIATLEAQITSLQNEITRLSGLMEDYEDMRNQAYEVNFYVGDSIVHTDAIKSGNSVEEIPSVDMVKYWKLADGTQVDPLTYTITANTNFYAETYEVGGYVSTAGGSIGSFSSSDGFGFLPYVSQLSYVDLVVNDTIDIYMPDGFSTNIGYDSIEKFYIKIIGIAEVSEVLDPYGGISSVSLDKLYISEEMLNMGKDYYSSFVYEEYEPEIIEFTRTAVDPVGGYGIYSSTNSDFSISQDSYGYLQVSGCLNRIYLLKLYK